ncbi:MAG: Thermosome subunit alpha [Methanomassiliicoccales archaeon PtaB.Bin134]|nr:MAG: Thermosome subunit alpha [Methanomassiliicoccales archaeon PtaB.Bin134]
MVKSTLGPRGMDKMMVDTVGDVTITNDGVTILKDLEVQHPAAKMVVEVSKTLDEECGDGTTSAVIILGELLKRSVDLLDADVHPTNIVKGYRLAGEKALEILRSLSIPTGIGDEASLRNIATTAMMSKAVTASREHMADLAVRAVRAVAEKSNSHHTVDLDNIQIVKREGGSMEDTELLQGIIIDGHPPHPSMPRKVRDARIALLSSALEVRKTEVSAEIQITEPSQLQAFVREEENTLREMVRQLKKAGATAVFCQKGIDELAQHFLAQEGILALQRVKASDLEKLSKATNAGIVTKPADLGEGDLGGAASIEVRKIESEEMTFVTGCENPRAVSILIRGGTKHVVDEIERSLDDALNVVRLAVEDEAMVTGGGSTAMELAMRLHDYADEMGGREQLAISAFARSMEAIPAALAENAGWDALNVLIEMRKAHKAGDVHAGLNVFTGKIEDMGRNNILEPLRVNSRIISAATEAASLIIRIDDVIAAKTGGAGAPTPGGEGEMPED